MSSETESNGVVSSASRPLNLRMRADVSVQRQQYQGRNYWVIKDPLSLQYYRFEEEEYALLQLIDGTNSPEQIKRRFDYEFAPQKITLSELYQFVGMLYRSCLLVSDAPGQGVELQQRGATKGRRKIKSTLSNVLAIRFKGFDPDRLLSMLDGVFWWVFTWPAFFVAVALWLSAAGLLFTHFEIFSDKLPGFHEFFAAKNWIWLALVMAVTKILHEFGHGLACKRFGGQCHEMGVMLLVLTPCLYCNVSDSWTLPNKWKRALIAAAGMYVELVLAAIATFVWWFSQPGIVNQLALNIIFVSSVSTILFNGNPLLRYDGYYILSDLLEIPNLRQKATTILQRQMARLMLGIESKSDPFLPARRKWFFASYSVAAALYRWVITFSIFWFLYSLLEPYGVKVIGQAIALVAIWGLIGMPLVQAYKFFSVPGRFGTVNRNRAIISALLVSAGLAGIMLIPIPRYIRCPLIVQPLNAENVYVDVPGTVTDLYVRHGQPLTTGQPLIRLTSASLDTQIVQLEGKINVSKSRYESLIVAANSTRQTNEATGELIVAAAELQTARSDLAQREMDLDRLVVRAPNSGYLIPPAAIAKQSADANALPQWNGYPLEPRNVGAFLEQSTVVARVVPDPKSMEAILVIDQSEIEFVQSGQQVCLFIKQTPGSEIRATTATVSPIKMTATPKALASRFGGDLITTQNEQGADVPQSATFQVSVPFDNDGHDVVDGATGYAKVSAGSQAVGQRIWRLIQKTFRFDL